MSPITVLKTAVLTFVILLPSVSPAEEWSQWRGPGRDGHAGLLEIPASWPEKLAEVWRVEVGEGYSAPVVADGQVFILTRQGDDEVALALDLATGKTLWSKRWPTPYEMNQAATGHGKWPRATPIVADGVACFLGVDARLTCHHTTTGEILWTRDFSEKSGSEGNFCGSSMSPLVNGGILYAHLGDDRAGRLFAADLRSGEERWGWEGQGPSYASPVLLEIGGVRQLVTLGAVDLLGFDAATGELLWSRPFPDEWNQNIVTPLQIGDRLLFADVENGTLAVWPERTADGWKLRELWHEKELTQYMASPVTDSKVVYGFSNRNKGQLFVMDPATGKVLWQDDGRGGRNAILTLAGPWLLVTSSDAELSVYARENNSLRQIRRYTLAPSSTWAHPAWLPDGLLVKDVHHLTRLALARQEPTEDSDLESAEDAGTVPNHGR